MIKLCLFTFKCRLLQWFKRTLPLACALDLAALENIPSLSFRNVYRYPPGVMKLFSVLILIPRCVRCIPGPRHSRHWSARQNWSLIKTFILKSSLSQIKSDLEHQTPNTWRLVVGLLTLSTRAMREHRYHSHACTLIMKLQPARCWPSLA